MRRVIILGAGGRAFHDFNVVFRDDPATEVVAFVATQTPGIDGRIYPASLAGSRYPEGIPIRPEAELAELITANEVDEVVFSQADLSHEQVMHKASLALGSGADFRLLAPRTTMLTSSKPVVAVCAVRTGAGKSQTSRRVAELLLEQGLRVVLISPPLPCSDLDGPRVRRFATPGDLDALHPTIEEREEYEAAVELGLAVYTGVDYPKILAEAEMEADVLVWDGHGNDLPFYRPDLLVVVVDPLRAGQELKYHPGETNLRLADVVVVNKVDSAGPTAVERVLVDVAAVNPTAAVVRAASPVTLEPGLPLPTRDVLVVEDGPSITRGGMPYGAGTIAAQAAGAPVRVDPRPVAVGSIADVYAEYPHIGAVLPAMGYSDEQLRDLEATINAVDCDIVVSATPIDLGRLIDSRHPIRRARYELRELGEPTLADVLAPIVERAVAALDLVTVHR